MALLQGGCSRRVISLVCSALLMLAPSATGSQLRRDPVDLKNSAPLVPEVLSLSATFNASARNASDADKCQAAFKGTCQCSSAVEFVNQVVAVCSSEKCNCQEHHFEQACGQMSSLCPGVGLNCTGGKATCLDNGTTLTSLPEPAVSQKASKIETAASKLDKNDNSSSAKKSTMSEAAAIFKAPEVFPVPTTSRCIVIMICQYMIILTALAIYRSYIEFGGADNVKVQAGLKAAAQTVTYGPMLCVLFIACRMRVEFLSDGKDQPQMWVQNCMYAVTFAVLGSTVVVLLLPLVTGKPVPLKEGTCDLEKPDAADASSPVLLYTLSAVRYLILLGLYGGLVGVIYGICTYLPPGETDLLKLPAPAPAVMCTMILAVLFFVTQIIVAGCRSYSEFTGTEESRIVGVMNSAAQTVEFGPMLAILFLAARMRALQHDGQPQAWAQRCMYASTGALCLTTVLAVAVPLALGGTMNIDPKTQEAKFEVPDKTIGVGLVAVRFSTMFLFYGGAVGVAVSIFKFEAPAGPEHTLPVSPTVQCVMNLAVQFFLVYLVSIVMSTVQEVSGGKYPMESYRFFGAIQAAKTTVTMAPMLAILFVTTRMYALLLTDKKGAPQAWVQDGMYMSTWALLVSFVTCLATGAVMEVKNDEDGNVTNKFSNKYVGILMMAIRYLSMVLLYGGIITVIVGLFKMTPETANGRGAVPFVSDTINSTPIGNPPPGPSSLPSL